MKRMLKTSANLALLAGVVLVLGALWAMNFTYQNVARENIVTPEDASIPSTPVRGPFTLKAEADIIREHTLHSTGGLTYAEMPREVPKLDSSGNPVLDGSGEQVMVPNDARNIWVTATALMTALNLGIVTYAFSLFILLFGLVSIWTGLTFKGLSKRY